MAIGQESCLPTLQQGALAPVIEATKAAQDGCVTSGQNQTDMDQRDVETGL